MDAITFLNLVVALAAVASAVFAFVQARSAMQAVDDAREAQAAAEASEAEARKIASEARDELSRSANALEKANELAEAALPKPEVRWRIAPTKEEKSFLLINDGTIPATNVEISGGQGVLIAKGGRVGVLETGDAYEFSSWSGHGMETPRLVISWVDSQSIDRQVVEMSVRNTYTNDVGRGNPRGRRGPRTTH